MRINELNVPVQPDTYEASMFLTQAIRAGKYAIKIHNLLSNDQELESWVAKKIDLASGYINDVAEYLSTEKVYKEDAGEGHMAKSQLYSVAKLALAITTMVQPGNDIEGWVQTKMNRAVDMLDAVYHYEDYQRLNPYREEIGDLHQKHAEIVKKNIDEKKWLYLYGESRKGKTHLASAIYQYLILQGIYAKIIKSVNLDIIISDYDDEWRKDKIDGYKNAHVLIIDDLGIGKLTNERHSIYYLIIDYRLSNDKQTIFTSNYRTPDLWKGTTDIDAVRIQTQIGRAHF